MEYYAKSPTHIMEEFERKELSVSINELITELSDELSQEEIKLLEAYGKSLKEEVDIEHKILSEHLNETVKCAEEFFDTYGDYFNEKQKKLILMACSEHDVGKANYIFQTKVNPLLKKQKTEEIPHGFLSALILNKNKFLNDNMDFTLDDFRILLTAVYYHHNRKDICNDEEMEKYCIEHYLEYVREYKNDKEITIDITNRSQLLFVSSYVKGYIEAPKEDVWCEYMLVKGMLNKFDWSVSAGYHVSEIKPDRSERRLCNNIVNEMHGELRPVQEFMLENKDNNVVIVAPTGSGKTEAGLLWLNGEKGFYTLPLKVSSNAIYRRIKEKYKFEHTALLHSDSMSVYIRESEGDFENGYRNYEQAKLFSYPLTVCTVDQLFKFVYKALGTEIFAATLKYSKVIIDEIQSYSPNIVAALLYGLSELKRMGGKFAIMTATFPPVLKYFMRKCNLIEGSDYLYEDFSETVEVSRHRLRMIDGHFDVDVLVEDSHNKKVLVICNTVSKAQKLYEELRDKCDDIRLLHSRFIRKHRDILEHDIMEFSNDKTKTGIWITTQIVEASLDIDFDALYTEMCTADSLLQRMGRCNRAGKKSTEEPNIIIFNDGNIAVNKKVDGIYDKDIYGRSMDFLKKYEGALFSESDKIEYINEVYDTNQIKKTAYYKQIDDNLKKFRELVPMEYNADEANEDFRDIHSITVIPEDIYNENRYLIEKIYKMLNASMLHKGVRKILKSKLESITLSINLRKCFPNGIDRDVMKPFDIHIANLKYDFDEETGRGMGLCLDKPEEEVYIV